jgi:long-chain fatty acid transport protein
MAVSGGYQLNEQNARAVGMGGAFVATASDPSAIYFNPAGLAFQNGINVLGGINFIMPSQTFDGSGTQMAVQTKTNSQVFTPFNVYGSYQVNDQIVVGLGIYNPFGLGTQWPDKWGQALNGIYVGSASSVNASIATYYFNPTIAYKINDQLSVGLGVSYVYGTVSMSQTNPSPFGGYFKSQLDGTGNGFNANIGVMYKPTDQLSFGLSYRMTTKIDFSGNATFTNIDVPTTVYLPSPPYPAGLSYWNAVSSKYPGGTGTATLPMPGNLYLGVAYQLQPDLRVEGDFQWVQWSSYDQLQINLTPAVTGGQGNTTSIKNWNDGYLFRIGAEYTINDQWTVRAGGVEDLSPQPPSKTEPMLPDGDRTDITVGGSYKISSNFHVDVAYMLVLFAERNAAASALPGTYNCTAHVASVNFGYSF